MRIWRALTVPFDIASLLFILISAVLLAFLAPRGLYAALPMFMLITWLFKYGFAILEHVAHGHAGAPVFDHELLSLFAIRPWLQAGVCAAGYLLLFYLDKPASSIVAVLECLLLPAWVGLLGIADHLYQAFNPLALWRMLRGMGLYYLVVLVLIAFACLIFVSVNYLPLWLLVRIALMEACVLACYSVIGEAVYARRLEVGFSARSSPERKLEQESEQREKLRQHAIDEIYEAVNARQYVRATGRLEAWLATVDPAHIRADAHAVAAAAMLWRNEPGTSAVFQGLVGRLITMSQPADALEVAHSALARLPKFCLTTEPATLALAEAARSLGQPRFAYKVLDNFAQQYPNLPLSARAVALRAECTP
ncbi:MAG: hypothetical protein ABSE43_05505 [Steroidobacteraceae bacterium]|jgi:hypothetical protein